MFRNTYVEVNLKNIKYNVDSILKKYPDYKYYIGVVKANCYGHGIKSVKSIIDGGCNYLAVATLEEALEIREFNKTIPILCLGVIPPEYLSVCTENNITVTINSSEYLKTIEKNILSKLKVHIKLNTGMNRLGISKNEDLNATIKYLNKNNTYIEGIYTHIYETNSKKNTIKQLNLFETLIKENKLENIPIIHCQASEAITNYPKPDIVNGCRLGIIIYGFTNNNTIPINPKAIKILNLFLSGFVFGFNHKNLIFNASIPYTPKIIK